MSITRRAALGLGMGLPALAASVAAATPSRHSPAPSFLWGCASAGHQVEGNNVASDIWLLEQVQPTLFKEPSGDACDSLNRWPEDLNLVRSLGLNCYRFSIEWARIEPAPGQFSLAALDFYKRMIAACRERDIAPVVTFNHFTSPRWFAARGGWEVADAPDLFARYCERAARHLADGISHAVTMNEPNLQWLGKWQSQPMPPAALATMSAMLAAAAKASGSERFSLLNAGDTDAMLEPLLKGHREARAAIKATRGDLPVGLSLAIPDDQPHGKNSRIEDKRRDAYKPFFKAAADDDFIGVQTYSRSRVDAKGSMPPPQGAELTQVGDEFYPHAIGGAIRHAHSATGKPVLITENGIATEDDTQRVRFISGAVEAVKQTIATGVPVLGYIHWSLLDNFEWLAGYGPKFGLVVVDRTTFKRTLKPSALTLAQLAKANATTA